MQNLQVRLLFEISILFQRQSIGLISHFSAIHFRGRAIRQVSFYTDSLAGSDFHGHRPAVYMNLHPLWFLISVNFGTLTLRSVHPASPVLLTRVGPLRILYFIK